MAMGLAIDQNQFYYKLIDFQWKKTGVREEARKTSLSSSASKRGQQQQIGWKQERYCGESDEAHVSEE